MGGIKGLVEQMKSPMFVSKGGIGYGVDETQKVEDDGKGWVWLAAEMSPGGLAVELFKSVLAVASYSLAQVFVAPSSSALRSQTALRARGGGEYDISDADIANFYAEVTTGSGGDLPRALWSQSSS